MASTVEAPVVQTSSTITTRAPSRRNPSISTPVQSCFSALRTRNPDVDGGGAHCEATDNFRLPPPLSDFVEKHLTAQASALGIKGRGAAIDVVVAGAA